jgi:hypothetical protein
MHRFAKATLVIAALGVVVAWSMHKAQPAALVTGTFSNLEYHQESGDLLGTEVRIVPSRDGLKAIVQFSEGEPTVPVVTDVVASGDRVVFRVPAPGSGFDSFEGIVSATELRGTFSYAGGATEVITLKRGCSYWDAK